jgi:Domain of unknown function (DUF4440)
VGDKPVFAACPHAFCNRFFLWIGIGASMDASGLVVKCDFTTVDQLGKTDHFGQPYNSVLRRCAMPRAVAVCALLVTLWSFASQDQLKKAPQKLPLPTDTDPRLTEQFRQTEKQFCDAILRKNAQALEELVGPEYTLRIADIPQSSLPRAIWMDNTLKRLRAESCEQDHLAARKLTDDFAAVSVVWSTKATTDGRDFSGDFYLVDLWRKRAGSWQIVARYSTPLGTPPDRGSRQPPPATDIDPQLTEQLRQLEQQLGEASMHRDWQVVARLMGTDFTLRVGDDPERSVPRALRQEVHSHQKSEYKTESLEEQFHAARKLADNLAVMSLLLTQKATLAGRDRSGDFYIVDIWRKNGDKWQIIARYSTPIGKKFTCSPPSPCGTGKRAETCRGTLASGRCSKMFASAIRLRMSEIWKPAHASRPALKALSASTAS